jgi:hypothetical protein
MTYGPGRGCIIASAPVGGRSCGTGAAGLVMGPSLLQSAIRSAQVLPR